MGDEGVDVFIRVRVAEQTRPLVADNELVILVDDVQAGLEDGEESVVLPGAVKELVVDVELQQVALHQAVVPLGALAVDLDPLEAGCISGPEGTGSRGRVLPSQRSSRLPGSSFFSTVNSRDLSAS